MQSLHNALRKAPKVQVDVTRDAVRNCSVDSEQQQLRSAALSRGLRKFGGLISVSAQESHQASELLLGVLADATTHGWNGPSHLILTKSKLGRGNQIAMVSSIVLSSVHLSLLDMYDCGLGPDGTALLMGGLQASPSIEGLRHLELGCNAMGHRGAMALAPALAGMTSLRHLGINNNDITHMVTTIMASLQGCTGLRALHLGRNRIEDNDLAETARALAAFPSLTSLDLGLNRCAHAGANALASSGVFRFSSLTELDISFNSLGAHNTSAANAATALGPLIRFCSGSLRKLALSHNSLSARDFMAIFDPSECMQALAAPAPAVDDPLLPPPPPAPQDLLPLVADEGSRDPAPLTWLDIGGNALRDDGLQQLMHRLGRYGSLSCLCLRDNKLTVKPTPQTPIYSRNTRRSVMGKLLPNLSSAAASTSSAAFVSARWISAPAQRGRREGRTGGVGGIVALSLSLSLYISRTQM